MNLNAIDWSEAQGLLVNLVHVLTELALPSIPIRKFLPPHLPFLRPEVLSALHSIQEDVERWVGESRKRRIKVLSREDFQELPLEKKAKVLIRQVQEVIGKLSHSSYIREPQMAPLRERLLELKPKLDQIVEHVETKREKETQVTALLGAPLTPNLKKNIVVRKKKKKEPLDSENT